MQNITLYILHFTFCLGGWGGRREGTSDHTPLSKDLSVLPLILLVYSGDSYSIYGIMNNKRI